MTSACAAHGGSRRGYFLMRLAAKRPPPRGSARPPTRNGQGIGMRTTRVLTWRASALWFGPTPAAEAIRQCEAMRAEVRESPESEAAILRQLACLNAIVGRFAIARELIAASNATYADLGLTLYVASSEHEAVVELVAGNPAAAERSARTAYRALEEMGERAFRSTMAASLAMVILEQGRDEEAEDFAKLSAQLAASGDLADADPLAPRACARARAAGRDPGGGGARARGLGDRRNDRLRQRPGGCTGRPIARARGLPPMRRRGHCCVRSAASLRAEGKRGRHGRDPAPLR